MSPSRWQRIQDLFHEALELPAADQHRFIVERCVDDGAMQDELRALLQSHSSVGALMSQPVNLASAAFLLREPGVAGASGTGDPWIGRSLGPYVIEAELGRGGMGVVYRAARIAGDLSQTVAIKVIASHLRSSPAVSQFLAERYTLALLNHRHVARLLDGGIVDGVPYAVMEYIEGRRLDEVCDEPDAPIETKIRLVLQLCEAVDYVHRNLILHRDLKPGNVMVTAQGVVKLLDFGTLKHLGAAARDSLMTQVGMRSVTVRYASPEYLDGEATTTAADIYSLGMILYRVVAGQLPKGLDALRIGQYLQELRSTEFEAPSLGLRAPRHFRHDLDAIVRKAIRYEPEQRYLSVAALADDLRNLLQNRSVAARQGGTRYRAGKFYRRHRSTVIRVGTLVLASLIGVGSVVRESRVLTAETRRAEAGVEQERLLAHLLLFDYFEELKRIPGSTTAQRRAVAEALTYLDKLPATPGLPALARDRVDGYTKMGNLLGSPYEENIGDGAGAIATLQKAIALAQALLASAPRDLRNLQSLAAAEQALGRVYFGTGDPRQAVRYLLPAAQTSARIAALPDVDSASLAQAASVVDSLGDVYAQEGGVTLQEPEKGINAYLQALSIDQAGLALDPSCARCRRGVALEYWKLGMPTEAIDGDKAAQYYQQGLDTVGQFSAEDQATPRVRRIDTVIRQRLGVEWLAEGRPAAALEMLRNVRERFRTAVDADPVDARARFDLAALDASLADGYEQNAQFSEALAIDREYLDCMQFLVAQDPGNTTWAWHRADALLRYGRAQLRRGPSGEGARQSREALSELVELAKRESAESGLLSLAATSLLTMHGDAAMAVTFAERAVAAEQPPSVDALLTLAEAQRAAGLMQDAQTSARRALELLAVHPRSVGNAEKSARANRLLKA
jgi:tetratricopeptide (TPR) repeat protein/predicted Ser/Thr protein kinase